MNKRIKKKKAKQIEKGKLLTDEQKWIIIAKLLKTKRGRKKLAKAMKEPKRKNK